MYLMSWFIPIKIIEGKEIYLYIALSMQKDHVKCTETPNICFELWLCCESRIFKHPTSLITSKIMPPSISTYSTLIYL